MSEHAPQLPQSDLSSLAQSRRDAMLPQLLTEVRRVRRRRILIKSASASAAILLMTGVLSLALLAPSHSTQLTPLAKNPVANPSPSDSMHSAPRVEILTVASDILERYAIRTPSLVRVEYINTDQALAILEAGGDRYGIIEIAGRVEFQLIAQK